MKIIIAGSRTIKDYNILVQAINDSGLAKQITEVVSGHCRGVDLMGERWARENEVPLKIFPAEWKKYGRSAGPRRNITMVEYAEGLIVLWDGVSPGTGHILQEAEKRHLTIFVKMV